MMESFIIPEIRLQMWQELQCAPCFRHRDPLLHPSEFYFYPAGSICVTWGILEIISGYLLVLSSWFRLKTRTSPFSRIWIYSMQSKKKQLTIQSMILLWKQSHFYGRGSTLWNKIKITHTCALSPSYLYSQVKDASSKRFITSPTPLVGWASMGRRGTPVKQHRLISF